MMPSAEVPLRLQRNIDWERTKRKLLRADSDFQIQNAAQRGMQYSDYLVNRHFRKYVMWQVGRTH